MEVPDSILKSSGGISGAEEEAGDHEAKMFTPGAAMSGCKETFLYFDTKSIRNH